MREYLDIIALGVLQGIGEFLPISSSGHLAIAAKYLGMKEDPLSVVLTLHAGTLVAVFVVYFSELLSLFRGRWRLLGFIAVGTVPIGVFGVALMLSGLEQWMFNNPYFPPACLVATGIMLLFLPPRSGDGVGELGRDLDGMTLKDAILVGLAQAVAVLPGISRSGTTIATASRLGLNGAAAAEFSFLLAIPAVAGASLAEPAFLIMRKGVSCLGVTAAQIPSLTLGFLTAAIVGIIALKLLLRALNRGKFRVFGYYCLAIGALFLLLAALA